jgi:hypothetical protein
MMAKPLIRKTFQVQFELSVEMESFEDTSMLSAEAASVATHLQEALLEDEQALMAAMRAQLAGKLKEYIDYMAAQEDELSIFLQVARRLEPKDQRFLRQNREDFDLILSLLRLAGMTVELQGSRIEEQVESAEPCPDWRLAWRDQLPGSPLGRMLKRFPYPCGRAEIFPAPEPDHFLVLNYLTQQPDGVHAEGRCTCGTVFAFIGEDDSEALQGIWQTFQRHDNQSLGANRSLWNRPDRLFGGHGL